MQISAKSDYAIRACAELAAADGALVKCESISRSQSIPVNFLVNILAELRRAGIVNSQRGADGGYWLARRSETITVGEIMRAVDREIGLVRGIAPQNLDYGSSGESLQRVWIALRSEILDLLDGVSLDQLVEGELGPLISARSDDAAQWRRN